MSGMSSSTEAIAVNVEKIRRTADLMCSMHSRLRDIYTRRALILDVSILVLTLWLTSLAFVDPTLELKLTPLWIAPRVWTGLLAVLTFLLAVIQLRVDWKGLADSHGRAASSYGSLKLEAARVGSEIPSDVASLRVLLDRYQAVGETHAPIPEEWFLKLKRHHYMKVAVSRLIDNNVGAPLVWLRFGLVLNSMRRGPRA